MSPTTNPRGAITDVEGVLVGHDQRIGDGWLTGCTVVVPPRGSVGGVDVRGGGPGTRETDALDPTTLVTTVDAVVLTGGSAYGLATADGVQHWCEEQGRGVDVGDGMVVPIVPAAVVFDLGRGGDPRARPDAAMGYAAASAARAGIVATGTVGAGTGALCAARTLKGGVGTASVTLDGGGVVGALVVLNAAGSPVDPRTGEQLAGTTPDPAPLNTTLAVVATTALLDPAQTTRTATAAQAGLARAVRPAHTLVDGDTVFAVATGRDRLPDSPPERLSSLMALQAAAADAVALAVLDAVHEATGVTTPAIDVRSYSELYGTAGLSGST